MIITLVGLRQAKKGFIFLHEGPLEECKNCELYRVCMENLEPRRLYVVTCSREKTFPCLVHAEGVKVVEVEKAEIGAVIYKKFAFKNGIITFQSQECEETSCSNYQKCVPCGIETGDKCTILEVGEEIMCPLGKHLVYAVLRLSVEAYPF